MLCEVITRISYPKTSFFYLSSSMPTVLTLCLQHFIFKQTCFKPFLRKSYSYAKNGASLFNFKRFYVKRSSEHEDMTSIRNIGIMAHIDAGKTTTTERMLYYSGFSKHLGDVDRGDTVTDYMAQERDRGITIKSAAITFHWNHHKINLIDTPGHVDFTIEVERCLRVLDGSVAVLDASAGVEAQTLTVWRQADKYNVPRIVFLNKMDKAGASIQMCLKSLRDKLHVTPMLLQLPVGEGKDFSGLIDLISFRLVLWDSKLDPDGSKFVLKSVTPESCDMYKDAVAARAGLIGQLADIDEHIADLVLSEVPLEDISMNDIQAAVRRATLSRKLVPVLCGSSLRNKGVQPLMDAIISYLPSPKDVSYGFADYYGTDLCALAFKVTHDRHRGALTFLRIYSGSLRSGSTIYNINRKTMEKTSRLLQVYADELHDISEAVAGNIVAVAGLKQTFTGDTLTLSQTTAKAATKAWEKDRKQNSEVTHFEQTENEDEQHNQESRMTVLAGVQVPAPVFFCSIEPPSMSHQKALDQALECLQKEDPSLKVEVNSETGQTILSGMGELHLDIIHSRIVEEYGIEADLGALQIAYRETITKAADVTNVLDKTVGDQRNYVHIRLSIQPNPKTTLFRHVEVAHSRDHPLDHLRPQHLKAIENGIASALANGPILRFPVIHVDVALCEFSTRPGTSLAMVSACAAQCVGQAVKEALPVLLEPMMKMEITSEEDHLHSVLGDLAQRRSQINAVYDRQDSKIIEVVTPLSELTGYSTAIRTITSGKGNFTMELSHYEKVAAQEQEKVVTKATGFPGL